jgi:RNase P subunit RPR2
MANHPRKQDKHGRFFCRKCKKWLAKDCYDSLSVHAQRSFHGIQNYCKECHKEYRYIRNSKPEYVFTELVRKAAKRNKEFTLPKDWAFKKYEKQKGKCFYTKIEMTFGHGKGRVWSNVSIDRINNDKGYTPENCVLCCLGFNLMKTNLPLDKLFILASSFIQNYNHI